MIGILLKFREVSIFRPSKYIRLEENLKCDTSSAKQQLSHKPNLHLNTICGQASVILQQVKDILNRRFQVNSQIHISFLGFVL